MKELNRRRVPTCRSVTRGRAWRVCAVIGGLVVLMLAWGAAGAAERSAGIARRWKAPNRWVHFDNVDAGRTEVFGAARHGWLRALQSGDSLLDDGRSLFWEYRRPGGSTFISFYPFAAWKDLDARRTTSMATQKLAGKEALDHYDSADSVLVPPHYSQIWRRDPGDDFVGATSDSLNEWTAACGWIEFMRPVFQHDAEIDSLWKQISGALTAERYPLTCRTFSSSYGTGEFIRMWLAPDSATLRATPPQEEVVARRLGPGRAKELFRRFNAYVPATESLPGVRRADMSNLGK